MRKELLTVHLLPFGGAVYDVDEPLTVVFGSPGETQTFLFVSLCLGTAHWAHVLPIPRIHTGGYLPPAKGLPGAAHQRAGFEGLLL